MFSKKEQMMIKAHSDLKRLQFPSYQKLQLFGSMTSGEICKVVLSWMMGRVLWSIQVYYPKQTLQENRYQCLEMSTDRTTTNLSRTTVSSKEPTSRSGYWFSSTSRPADREYPNVLKREETLLPWITYWEGEGGQSLFGDFGASEVKEHVLQTWSIEYSNRTQ